MPKPFTTSDPDQEEVQLRIMDEQVNMTRWTSYDFHSDYTKPAAGFHFTVADGQLEERQVRALKVGARVRLSIDDIPLADGHIDEVEIQASRTGGVSYSINGRERLGLAVDAIADPTQHFKSGITLDAFLKALYQPFGWVADEHFVIDNAASRNATKGLRGTPMTKGGKRKGPRPLKNFKQHQLKPHNHETVHDFAKRVAERHGLFIRCSEDGERLIIDRPNFIQPPSYQIRRTSDGEVNNVVDGSVRLSFLNQPAAIVADGFSTSDEFGRGRIKSYGVNPYFGFDEDGQVLPEILEIEKKHPTAKRVYFTTQPFTRRSVNVPPRIVYLHDKESQTQEQLDNFIRREMSLYMHKSLVCHYVVEGHTQVDEFGQDLPWFVDTVVDVQDDVADVHERMWVQSVQYAKSRSGGGTTTRIELVRLNSLQLGEEDVGDAKVTVGKTVAQKSTGSGNNSPPSRLPFIA